MNEEINREIMFHPEAEVEIRSADDSNDKQIADINYFIKNKFDIIIAAPNEADAITPIIKKAYDSGIPVIIFDRSINGDSYTAFQGGDNRGIGLQAAQYARHLTKHGAKIIEIRGRQSSTPATERHLGFLQGLSEKNDMDIVGEGYGDWNYEESAHVADSLLNLYPDADLIYAHNDIMAIAASETARRRGLHPFVIGVDAAPEIGIKAVADSVIDATFLYPTEGHLLVRTALKILRHEPYDTVLYLPPSSAVDLTNADILLLQNESLREETSKIKILKGQVEEFWERHSAQTILFYAVIAILLLLAGFLFLLLRTFWQHKKHQKVLLEQNHLLEEQRDLQESLNRQLQEATQSKLMFFTNVSHDLRTPLTLISEPIEQICGASNLTPRQQTLLKIASKNIRILKRLINQILDFRKYENGKLDLHPREVDFCAISREWAESFRAMARKHDIKLHIEIPDTPIYMALDEEKMERVFFNLMSNAFKFTPANGYINFRCRAEGDQLIFYIEDSGKGIKPGDIEKIFERFYQVEKANPEGSGIGLSLVKAFIELHGGTISAESEPGKGTKFTVTIPIRHIASTADDTFHHVTTKEDIETELDDIEPAGRSEDDSNPDKPLLLVIDDNADIRLLITELLGDEYNVITASNGRQGLKKAARYIPDLVICDVMMPEMDGLECCRLIKEEVSTSHIPVLMLTACSLDEQRIEGYRSGADGYLAKPFSGEVLAARSRSLIENRRKLKNLWPGSAHLPAAVTPQAESTPQRGDVADDAESEFYNRFLTIVREHMGDADLNVDRLATLMGLGRSQFYRKIKALTNYSPVELLRRLRMNQARDLLTTTDKSISEIAYEVGFSTPAYFTKCYRETFGETPSDLRDKFSAK